MSLTSMTTVSAMTWMTASAPTMTAESATDPAPSTIADAPEFPLATVTATEMSSTPSANAEETVPLISMATAYATRMKSPAVQMMLPATSTPTPPMKTVPA